jgi:hypothetical protein
MTLPPELKGMEQTAKLQIRVVAAESGRELHAIDGLNQTAGKLLDDTAAVGDSLPQGIQQAERGESPAFVQHQQEPPPPSSDAEVKAIAFYLPHYHPIPENDAWWGKGVTEWTHVTRATPQFAGHYQPQLPGELGFYDLRYDDVRERQARLAREHGIHGFCYSYSWFNGRRVLERPLEMMLEAGTPDFPFCICWANENWTGRWDGLDQEVLIEQTYDETSDLAFIEDVLPILKDPRYIRIREAPLLLVYRVDLLPDPVHTSAVWRQACKEAGFEAIHLCAVETAGTSNPYAFGFDSAVQFPPHRLQTRRAGDTVKDLNPQFTGRIYDYEWTVADEINAPQARYRRFRGVMTSWDNTARRGSASHIFVNATPEAYEVWLRGVVDATRRDLPAGERLLFINAWNDWAEGAHLEPDQKFGRAYLEATRRALRGTSSWQTLVEYATSREEMSGAVLANWISDVAALLKGQELSWSHLVGLQQEMLGTGHADTIVFSKVDSHPSSPTILQQGGHGNLEHVNDQTEPAHVEIDRGTPLYLGGWSFTEGVHLGPATPTVLIMENEETLECYEATLPGRSKRDDVMAAFPSIQASSTAFSGFAGYADVRRLQKGTYRLEVHHEVDGEAIRFTFYPRLQLV